MVRGELDVVGTDVTCVHKVGGISDHRTIYPQSLMVSPPPRALGLVEATGEPLQPDIASTGHLTAFQFLLHYEPVVMLGFPNKEAPSVDGRLDDFRTEDK